MCYFASPGKSFFCCFFANEKLSDNIHGETTKKQSETKAGNSGVTTKNAPKVIKRILAEERSRQRKNVSFNGKHPVVLFFDRIVSGLKPGS